MVRWDECGDDYTGSDKPGVWQLAPRSDTWKLPIDVVATIDHPGALRPKTVKLGSRKGKFLEVARSQVPLTHEDDMTFQNVQGKTIRGPEQQPKGFVIDLYKYPGMTREEYLQHLYMILGRARKLDWILLRNFPRTPDGEPDWAIFEAGPPRYLCEFLDVLQKRAKDTMPRLLRCQRESGLPAWSRLKPCPPDPENPGRYLYVPEDWGFRRRGCDAGSGVEGRRMARKRRQETGSDAADRSEEPGAAQRPLDQSPRSVGREQRWR